MRAIATAILLTLAAVVQADALFTESEPLRLTLTGPLEQIVDDAEARIELPFVLTIGETQVPVEVRTRGKSRLRVCRFPPLRLDFGRDGDVASAFSGYDKIKLVTHCSDKSKDDNVLYDEYFAYRLFALLTDKSYRTRWVNIRYVDSDEPDSPALDRMGFLVEPDDAFAERTGTEYRELPGVVYSKLDDAHATLVYVFQYLIGNTDWSLVLADGDDECCHNGDLFEADSGLLLVPYDFDLAGIVDASYAKPDPSLRIRSVRSRLYRGYCTDPGTVRAALEAVVARQAPIMELAKTTPAASPDDLEERIDYLQEFFEEAEDLEDMLETFERRCIG
jgi:hypothetical protein